ncbi:MAG TPA: hypothetical protein VED46_17495 [Alphaproteobacteria bacterium]|jgi:hypothetical protein|nr:hypothetical protein [Alphaproteobacteria bacterium]
MKTVGQPPYRIGEVQNLAVAIYDGVRLVACDRVTSTARDHP